jgi:hypothetical protein
MNVNDETLKIMIEHADIDTAKKEYIVKVSHLFCSTRFGILGYHFRYDKAR